MICGARRRDRARQARFVAWQAVACEAASVRSGESRFFCGVSKDCMCGNIPYC